MDKSTYVACFAILIVFVQYSYIYSFPEDQSIFQSLKTVTARVVTVIKPRVLSVFNPLSVFNRDSPTMQKISYSMKKYQMSFI